MAEINYSEFAAAAALVLTAGAGSALTNDANTKAALVTLEKSAYDAWKSKDAKYWNLFLSDRFVGWGASRLDKASATKEYTGADCDIKSYALSDEEISLLGENGALITHKTAVDGTCGGNRARLNPRLEILKPTPYLRLKQTYGKPGENTMPQKSRI